MNTIEFVSGQTRIDGFTNKIVVNFNVHSMETYTFVLRY